MVCLEEETLGFGVAVSFGGCRFGVWMGHIGNEEFGVALGCFAERYLWVGGVASCALAT